MTTEALNLLWATLDFCAVLGLLIGLFFGFEMVTRLPGNMVLITALARASLLGKLATVLVVLVLSLRVITEQRRFLSEVSASGTVHRHSMAGHMAACAWAAVVGLFSFQLMAALGYGVGVEFASSDQGLDAIDQLAQAYPVSDLFRNILRVLVEAALVAWIYHFDAAIMARQHEHLSRSATRRAIFIILSVFAVEALDSYLYWIVF